MPTYEFECPGGGDTVEVVIPLDRVVPSNIPCPTCGCEMNRVWNSPGVVFNAQGFYSTDRRT